MKILVCVKRVVHYNVAQARTTRRPSAHNTHHTRFSCFYDPYTECFREGGCVWC